MHLKKIVLVLVAVIFLATPAFADNIPEFEALCDSTNIFAVDGELTYGAVIENNIAEGLQINRFSEFPGEGFTPPAQAPLRTDVCFPDYRSYRTDPQFPAEYQWRFKLQMSPESDINVNIYDCVLKPQGTDIFTEAQQTGRVNLPDGSTRFFRTQNPTMTVIAEAGDGRFLSFVMAARRMPNLGRVALNNRLYTSKAHWEEGLVLEMPIEGRDNANGGTQHQLVAGDFIRVIVNVPQMHPARLAYGPDNVLLKYIGIVGSEIVWQDFFVNPINCE